MGRQAPSPVILQGGPADGHQIQPPPERFVWVSVERDDTLIYDLDLPEDQQRRRPGPTGWAEYLPDPRNPGVYRFTPRTP